MLCALDEFIHESLAIQIGRKLKATDVIYVLSDLFILRGAPGFIIHSRQCHVQPPEIAASPAAVSPAKGLDCSDARSGHTRKPGLRARPGAGGADPGGPRPGDHNDRHAER